MRYLLTAIALLTGPLGGAADAMTALERQGLALAVRMCGACHATGKTEESAHIAAPPFREIDRRVDLDRFRDQLRDGFLGPHTDMPMFRFSRDDATALNAYLRSIQGP